MSGLDADVGGPRSVSVVICTLGQRNTLAGCIQSVLDQHGIESYSIRVIVVDNGPAGRSQASVEARAAAASHPVRWVHEPRRNIALARNAGCSASRAEFVAFIDDDERAAPDWLRRLLDAAEVHHADAVCGPVLPDFEDGKPPAWSPRGTHFQHIYGVPAGAQLLVAHAGNLLLRRATCLVDAAPFGLPFGRSGGEDADFTYNLARRGRKIVWCPDAVVHEFVPRERTSMRFQLLRVMVQTQVFVRTQLRQETKWRAIIRGGWLILKGASLAVLSLPRALGVVFASRERAFDLLRPLMYGIGLAIWFVRIQRY